MLRRQLDLARFCRPAQFAARAIFDFVLDHSLKRSPRWIPETQPYEMKQLVYKDARKLGARAIEENPPFA